MNSDFPRYENDDTVRPPRLVGDKKWCVYMPATFKQLCMREESYSVKRAYFLQTLHWENRSDSGLYFPIYLLVSGKRGLNPGACFFHPAA